MNRSLSLTLIKLILVSLLLWLPGCNFPDSPPPASDTAPSLIESTPTPVKTGLPLPQPTLKGGSPPQEVQSVKIFLIALEDRGQSGKEIGCQDSAVPVEVKLDSPTQAVLRAALEALLSVHSQYYGGSGLYNSLYQSDLSIEKLVVENGEASIRLSGELKLGGVCDNPRVKAQLEETALQFPAISRVRIFINGIPLDKALSGQE